MKNLKLIKKIVSRKFNVKKKDIQLANAYSDTTFSDGGEDTGIAHDTSEIQVYAIFDHDGRLVTQNLRDIVGNQYHTSYMHGAGNTDERAKELGTHHNIENCVAVISHESYSIQGTSHDDEGEVTTVWKYIHEKAPMQNITAAQRETRGAQRFRR